VTRSLAGAHVDPRFIFANEQHAPGVKSHGAENVEIVRLAHEALNGGDLDALIALCDAKFRLDMSDRVFNPAVYEGYDGIRIFYSEVCDVWASYVWEPEALMEVSGSVVALLRSCGRGRGSGVEVERRTAMLWTVKAGRATAVCFFRDQDRALEAVGGIQTLAPEAPSSRVRDEH
jgi:ketosteroid isomerase-like protein